MASPCALPSPSSSPSLLASLQGGEEARRANRDSTAPRNSVRTALMSPSLDLSLILLGFSCQVLECRVCDNVYGVQGDKIPRLLYCGHSLCHACLVKLPKSDSIVLCPFDRQPTPMGVTVYVILMSSPLSTSSVPSF